MINKDMQLAILFFLTITQQVHCGMMNACINLIDRIVNSLIYICPDARGNSVEYRSRINREFADRDTRLFLRKFCPPEYLLTNLMQKGKLLISGEFIDCNNFKTKSNYVLTRVICAKRLQNIIEKNNYTRIGVPNKYLFLTNSDQADVNKRLLLCISEKIIPTQDTEITIDREQMKEFADVVLRSRFCDMGSPNFIVDNEKRIFFIDTDIESFSHGPRYENHNLKRLWSFLRLGVNNDIFTAEEHHRMERDFPESCKMHNVSIKVSGDAKEYLADLILLHEKSLNSTCRSFLHKNEYDSEDLKIACTYPKINTWVRRQLNDCKIESRSRWSDSFPSNKILQ